MASDFRDRTGKIVPFKLEEEAKKFFINNPNRNYVASGVLNMQDIWEVEKYFKDHSEFNIETSMHRKIGASGFFAIGDCVEYIIEISVRDPANYFNT